MEPGLREEILSVLKPDLDSRAGFRRGEWRKC